MSDAVLQLDGVSRWFDQGGQRLRILNEASMAITPGEAVALMGPSGSGKSTLLQIAGLLERPDAGNVIINGKPVIRTRDDDRTRLRRTTIGFVYQYHHLLPEFSAEENVILPQLIAGQGRGAARKRAVELLQSVGLGQRLDHRPARLSGGEQQRVAIARALANRPRILLADEPTGNLDEGTSDDVFQLLLGLVRETGLAALIATHNPNLADRLDRVLELRSGTLVQREARDPGAEVNVHGQGVRG